MFGKKKREVIVISFGNNFQVNKDLTYYERTIGITVFACIDNRIPIVSFVWKTNQ